MSLHRGIEPLVVIPAEIVRLPFSLLARRVRYQMARNRPVN